MGLGLKFLEFVLDAGVVPSAGQGGKVLFSQRTVLFRRCGFMA